MNSKEHLVSEAERLYIHEFMSLEMIATRLKLNRKTVMSWKEKYGWETKKRDFLKSKQSFHEELYEFARKLMKDISVDIENGEKIESGRMYAFCKLIPMFVKVKDYEDVVAKREEPKDKKRGLTDDIVAEIEENILGIIPNDRNKESREEK